MEELIYDKLMRKEYDNVWALCNQARDELLVGYKYFLDTSDYTGAYLFFCAICSIDDFHHKLDDAYSKTVTGIVVPNCYEWGFFEQGFWDDKKKSYVDFDYLKTINTNCKEIRFKNGAFYGYYCYNTFSKCSGWLSNLRYDILEKAKPMYDCAKAYFENRMVYYMKFENK